MYQVSYTGYQVSFYLWRFGPARIVTLPSFIYLFSGNSAKPLYFVKLTSKDVTEMDISDPHGHFVAKGESYFQDYYLKLCLSEDIKVKTFTILPGKIAVTPDEVYHQL